MRYFSKLFICLFLVLPIYAQAGAAGSTDAVQLIQTDDAATQLSAYYDLRERHSFIQVTNVTSSPVTIHVQIFQHDRGCTELNFDDTLTGNDTVVYDLENLIKNNGSQAPINLQDDSYGYVVVTDRVVDSETSPTPSLIGNFRVVDDAGYEYRTNMVGASQGNPLASDLDEIDFQAHFNTVDGAIQADLVGYLYTNSGTSTVRNFAAGINFDIFVYDFFEEPLSCDRRNFACGNVMNYGINEDYGSSKGNPPVCPGGGLADFGDITSRALSNGLNGGFVDFTNGALGAPSSQLPVFVYLIGINNGNGTGSMDTWIDPTVPIEICDDGIDNDDDGLTDCEDNDCGIDGTGNGADICYEATCDDMMDNEEMTDGLIDCLDPDCDQVDVSIIDSDMTIIGSAMCEFGEEMTCNDMFDNDGDDLVDCEDMVDCSPINSNQAGECGTEICDDNFDNDGDGWIDCDDADCESDENCVTGCQLNGFCRVFFSQTTTLGNIGGIDGADAICQGEANASSRTSGGTYFAWIATDTVNPNTRFTQSTVPYVLVNDDNGTLADNTQVAADYAALTNTNNVNLLNAISLRADGTGTGFISEQWTGVNADGSSAVGQNCSNWTSNAGPNGVVGNRTNTDSNWTNTVTRTCGNQSNPKRLYCFEQ